MSKTNGKATHLLRRTLRSGAIASSTTTLALGALGLLEDDDSAAPLNAVSHILYGDDDALNAGGADTKHTLAGGILNAASVTMWAGIHELLFGKFARKGPAQALASGAAVSGLAYVVDYHVVPKRLTPGFEKKLSKKRMFATYAVLALSLAAGAWVSREEMGHGGTA